MSIRVIKPGLLSSVQDCGRHGHAALGVGHAGAMDLPALRLANALVDNAADAAALELTLLGPTLHFEMTTRIALCGADLDARLDGIPVPMWCVVDVAAGSTLDATRMRSGVRAILAVAGGLAVTPVLGSASADINAGLGPRALHADDLLATGPASACRSTRAPSWSIDPRPWFDFDVERPLRLIRGSHFEALDSTSRLALFDRVFRVSSDSNRVGLRLDGVVLALAGPLEQVSEPVTTGTVQLPPAGQPIVLMAEHPTTGGYPRIGQVAAVDLPRLAQRRPGDHVRFSEITLDDAFARYRMQQRELDTLIAAIHERNHR